MPTPESPIVIGGDENMIIEPGEILPTEGVPSWGQEWVVFTDKDQFLPNGQRKPNFGGIKGKKTGHGQRRQCCNSI